MNPQDHLFIDPPALSDKTACDILDFLHQLICVFEFHYAKQLLNDHNIIETLEPPDPLDGFDDDLPPF